MSLALKKQKMSWRRSFHFSGIPKNLLNWAGGYLREFFSSELLERAKHSWPGQLQAKRMSLSTVSVVLILSKCSWELGPPEFETSSSRENGMLPVSSSSMKSMPLEGTAEPAWVGATMK